MGKFMRRMKDMAQMRRGMSFYGAMPDHYKVAINGKHPAIVKLLKSEDELAKLAKQEFDLALLSQGTQIVKKLTEFVKRSVEWI